MRKRSGVVVAVLAAAVLAVTALIFTGNLSLVTTHGISMAPRIHTGDLVVVRAASDYRVGDAVAYESAELDTVVLHRIVKIQDGHYSFQGDNNAWVDPERPTEDKLIGKELLHIPHGGVWLERLTSPVALGLLAFSLLALGGNATRNRHVRRRRRTVSQHSARPSGRRKLAGLPHYAATAASCAALVGLVGTALGFAAWTTSATADAAMAAPEQGQQMTFDYEATVTKSPAYDDTTVTAPEPVFRKLADTVDVSYTYAGPHGEIAVSAELSTASGWSSTVPLQPATEFADDRYTGTATLDLDALERRAAAAAAATGIPASDVTVSVTPTVTTAGGEFVAELPLTLSPLSLTLTGDQSSLTVGHPAKPGASAPTAPVLTFAGRTIPVTTARAASVVMVGSALLAAVVLALIAWISAPATESAAIRRRYANLLVEVQPMPTPSGRPVVDVADFATLAKLADRYELLVLHWSRSAVETFVVQDQGTTYRYRTGSGLGELLIGSTPAHV